MASQTACTMPIPEELHNGTLGDINAVKVFESSGITTIGGVHYHNVSEQQPKQDRRTFDIPRLQDGLKQFYKLLEAWYHPIQGFKTRRHLLEDYYVELHLEGIHRSGENVIQPTVPIQEAFMSSGTYRLPTRILVKGHAGYGKSTFCKRLVHDWVEDSTGYMSAFQIVILIRLRDVTTTIEQEVTKLCNRAMGMNYGQDQVIRSLQGLGRKVLFVLDGYDEISEAGKLSLAKIIEYRQSDEESFLKLATVLMTTRPVYQLDDSNSMTSKPTVENETTTKTCKSFERILNIGDLTGESQIAFIEKYFRNDTTKADKLKEIVRKTEMKLTRSPLLLHITCYIHEQGKEINANEDFWEQYLRIIFKRAVSREIDGPSNLDEDVFNSLVLQLGEICFKHLKRNELYIEEKEIYEAFVENAPFIMSCGVLGKTFSLTSEHSNLLEPTHKTLMEHLAVKFVNDGFVQAKKSGRSREFASTLILDNPKSRYIICIITSTTLSMEIPIPHLFSIQFLFEVGPRSEPSSFRLNIIPLSKSRNLIEKNFYSARIHYWYEGIVGISEFIEKSISVIDPDMDGLKCFKILPKLLDIHVKEFQCLQFYVSTQCRSAFCEAVAALSFDRSVNVSLRCVHQNNRFDNLYPQTECQLEEISIVLLSKPNAEVFVNMNHKLREDQLAAFLLKEHRGDLSLSYVKSGIHDKFLKDKQNKEKLRLRKKAKYVKIENKFRNSQLFVEFDILSHGLPRNQNPKLRLSRTESLKNSCILL